MRESAIGHEDEADEESSDPAVSVEERVDCLELGVGKGGFHQRWSGAVLVMDKPLQVAQSREDFVRRRRYVGRVPGPSATDPILSSSELTRILRCPSALLEETAVGFLEESKRKGKGPCLDLVGGVEKGVHVVCHFSHVINGRSRSIGVLVAKEVGQSGLRPLDLAREDCFFADVHVEEAIRI
jgi:hypothetical protein